jgi:eukaryotic-like serine/threonine-protein kinase
MKNEQSGAEHPSPSDIFAAAQGIEDAQERSAYLAEACRGRDALRRRIEAMLARNIPASFLRGKAEGVQEKGEVAGELIGPYRLIEIIGSGGFGVVWRATQEAPLRREVALKIIHVGMATQAVMARFEAERQALAAMDHPNIARVFDAGTTTNGRPYFVMELLARGVKITEYCDQKKLTKDQRLALFIQVCQAIQHAHQKGLIHRDIKPSNILVTEYDGKPVPKVIDFGIAKAVGDPYQLDKGLTSAGQVVGTPDYMSPEQADLKGLDIDTRSDIYSLGALLYELLTGQTPLSLQQAAMDEMLRMIREQDPVRLSTRLTTLQKEKLAAVAQDRGTEPATLPKLVCREPEWIVTMALEKDRKRRYQSATDLAMDIAAHLDNKPLVFARPQGWSYLAGKFVRRHRVAFLTGSAIAFSVLAGFVTSSSLYLKASKLAKRETGLVEQANADAKKAKEALNQFYFLQSSHLLESGDVHTAMAYLARSLRMDPSNNVALTRLVMLMNQRGWMIPRLILKQSNAVDSARFTRDGARIVSICNKAIQFWDRQSGHALTAPVKCDFACDELNFSPDGSKLVVFGSGGFQVRDAVTGEAVTSVLFPKGAVGVSWAGFTPNGQMVVATTREGAECVWKADSSTLVKTPQGRGEVTSANLTNFPGWQPVGESRISPDGKQVILVSANRISPLASVCDVETGKVLASLPLSQSTRTASFAPDGLHILGATDEGAILWDAGTFEVMTNLLAHPREVKAARFSPDGKRIVAALWNSNNLVKVLDPETIPDLMPVLGHDQEVTDEQFSPDGTMVLTVAANAVYVWDARTGRLLTVPGKCNGEILSAEFSTDGRQVLTASNDKTICLWDLQIGQAWPLLLTNGAPVSSVAFSPKGEYLLSTAYGETRLWNLRAGQLLAGPMTNFARVESGSFSPDGRLFVTAGFDQTAVVREAPAGRPLKVLKCPWNVEEARFSLDGNQIITRPKYESLEIWETRSGKLLWSDEKLDDETRVLAVSQDARRIVTETKDDLVQIRNVQSSKLLRALFHSKGLSKSAQLSPDGTRVLTLMGGSASLWDAETAQLVTGPWEAEHSGTFSFDGIWISTESSSPSAVCVRESKTGAVAFNASLSYKDVGPRFSVEGRVIAALTNQTAGAVWDIPSGDLLADPFKAERTSLLSVALGPEGRKLAAGCEDGIARVWDVGTPGPVCPNWLPSLAEALSGFALNSRGSIEPVTNDRPAAISQIRESLQPQPAETAWDVWGRWFLADRSTATISASSVVTLPQYIDTLLREQTLKSVGNAQQAAVGCAGLSARVEQARQQLAAPIEQWIAEGTRDSLWCAWYAADGDKNFESKISQKYVSAIERCSLDNTPAALTNAEALIRADTNRLHQVLAPARRLLFERELALRTEESLGWAEALALSETNWLAQLALARGTLITGCIDQGTERSLNHAKYMARGDANAWSSVPLRQRVKLVVHLVKGGGGIYRGIDLGDAWQLASGDQDLVSAFNQAYDTLVQDLRREQTDESRFLEKWLKDELARRKTNLRDKPGSVEIIERVGPNMQRVEKYVPAP